MNNLELGRLFRQIADLLELKGESVYKIRAYRRAADSIERAPSDVAELRREGRLTRLEGVGKAIAAKIEEFLDTGQIAYLERLKGEVPVGLLEVLAVPGIGPALARRLHEELGISSLIDLQEAVAQHRLQTVPGVGRKKEQNIAQGLEWMQQRRTRTPIGVALPLARAVRDFLDSFGSVQRVEIAGSLRRWCEDVGDIDIVIASVRPREVLQQAAEMVGVKEVLEHGETKLSVQLSCGLRLDVRVVSPAHFAAAWHHFTGSAEHNILLRRRAQKQGLLLNEYGLTKGERGDGDRITITSEEDIYRALGLCYVPPELRCGRDEVSLAEADVLPHLVQLEEIRGDLHVHSQASDGRASLREIAQEAQSRGLDYVAICDHSRSLRIANGLTAEELQRQGAEIERLNRELVGFRLLKGVEVEILADGSLDLDDELLASLDIVVACVHTGFGQDVDTITKRIVSAMENPHVDVIAHPTGRLIGRRDPYPVDIKAVIEAAARTRTALEINANPERLDLRDVYAKMAVQEGVKLAVSTDAHSLAEFDHLEYGVATARRGWAEARCLLNAMKLDELLDYLND